MAGTMPHRPLSSASLRSHFVPRVYLRAWADEAGRLAVRRRSETVAALRHVGIIGVDRGLYGTGPSAEARERMFGQIESAWLATRPALIDAGGLLPRGERDAAAVFIAMQMARTREKLIQIEFVSDFARFDAQRPVERESVRRYLRERHLRADPSDQEVEGAWTVLRALLNGGGAPPSKDEIMGNLMNAAVREVAPRLGAMRWTLERCRKPSLLTSDRPAMCWRPPSFRDAFEGIGIENAVEVRVPVAPRHLLVLRHAGLNTGIVDVAPARLPTSTPPSPRNALSLSRRPPSGRPRSPRCHWCGSARRCVSMSGRALRG